MNPARMVCSRALGVDGLIIAHGYYPLSTPPPPDEWENVFSSSEGTVYHRRGGAWSAARAWNSDEPGAPRVYAPATVRVLEDSRMGTTVAVDVPAGGASGLVAFRRAYFPGYEALLDGTELPVTAYQGLLPIVKVPAGSHGRMVLRYRPRAVVWGAAMAAACLLGMVVFVIFPLPAPPWKGRKNSGTPENLRSSGTR